jgi:hypothetical protein
MAARTVGDSLGLYWAFKAESTRLRHVGGYLVLTKAEVVRFPALESIGGSFVLTLLAKIVDVPKLNPSVGTSSPLQPVASGLPR